MRLYDPSRIAELLERDRLDAVAACTRENVLYLGGFDPVIRTLNPYHGVCWIVVLREAPETIHIVHSQGEADQVLDAAGPIGECALYGTFYRELPEGAELDAAELRLIELMSASPQGRSAAAAIIELLSRLGLKAARVALDEDGTDSLLTDEVSAALPNCRFSPGSELLREIRRIKTSEEVARLAAAARAIEFAIAASTRNLRPGVSELEIARQFEIGLATAGARPALTMLKIGRAAVTGQRRQLASVRAAEGDLIWFDCDVMRDGYWADVARVFALADPRRHRRIFNALHAGQREAMELIRPGMTGGEVFDLTMSAVHRSGLRTYRRHHVGHGIGLEPYERPILAPGSPDRIETGMVISVETPYYEYGLGALHVEDPILVGEDGNRRLTETDGALQVLGYEVRATPERLHVS